MKSWLSKLKPKKLKDLYLIHPTEHELYEFVKEAIQPSSHSSRSATKFHIDPNQDDMLYSTVIPDTDPREQKKAGKAKPYINLMDETTPDLSSPILTPTSVPQEPHEEKMQGLKNQSPCPAVEDDEEKIKRWTEGKSLDICTLLCTLHTVSWPGMRWSKVTMDQLATSSDVRRKYLKACLAVHPDHHIGKKQENLSNIISKELNMAWFEYKNQYGDH